MPLSSKKIIESIKILENEFSTNNLIDQLVKKKPEKIKPNSKIKKKKNPQKDIDNIHSTLRDLYLIEYIDKKSKNRWQVTGKYPVTGKIKIDKKGNGIVNIKDITIKVKKDFCNKAHNNDEVAIDILDLRKGEIYGKVLKINKRGKERYFAIVDKKTKGLIYYKLLDIDANLYVCSNRYKNEPSPGQYVAVRIPEEHKMLGGYPECTVEKIITSNSEDFDFERIVTKYHLPGEHRNYNFSKNIDENINPNEFKNRTDYTNLLTVTIDGDHAKDFDDAISYSEDKNQYKLYVHIADVSAFVEKNSPLDIEARKRGTSYYLGNKVIPMLPEMLSNNFCSLVQKVKRYTLSVEMVYDKEFNLVSYKFNRAIIKVDKRLTYKIAQDMMKKPGFSKIGRMLAKLNKFTKDLKQNRIKKGRVDLQLSDPEMIFNNNTFEDIIESQRLESHSLIEECMLSANEVVSKILKDKKVPTLYRVHENMSNDKLYELKQFFRNLGLRFKTDGNLGVAIQEIVDSVAGKEDEKVINFIILRSMMQAYYGPEPLGHFGLGFKDYTHFTSPIRRYPDLIVHRTLKGLIDSSPSIYSKNDLSDIGRESSDLERKAQKAERDLFKLKSCRLLEKHIGETMTGIISGVSKFGLFITLKDKPIEGMVPLKFLTDDYYLVKENEYTAVGRKHGKSYSLGNEVVVKILRSDTVSMQIDFEIINKL